ncbi:MAG: hypothetical protein A2V81_02050 [Candidatus Abawacabacteria bacterium RBG_16_42_10]|uniref:PDZ domain-containing protein n=1 Tax=Candidatus Abawacabacteria bacterium RBG_16_42_10 TaxID=1817814 RepID=A0A1F4XKX1_9BACT|nr:MAG: hypothetical protein A2V81_02050 [Candidatus Abawacabacteria bacterium RBG_16_42_10]
MVIAHSHKRNLLIAAIAIISVVSGFTLGSTLAEQNTQLTVEGAPPTATATSNSSLNYSLLNQAWDKIKNNFYFKDKINNQDGVYGATYGLINSLNDPYTVFFTPEESNRFQDSLDGTLEGIGAELAIFDGSLTVSAVLKDSPAFQAGLHAKDIIYKINEDTTSELTLGEAVSKIRGPRGTTVTLTIVRDGEEEPLILTITRDVINIKEIDYEMLESGIAYIRVSQFTDDTKRDMTRIADEITAKNPKGIILDLRWNPGGFMEGAIDVASVFIKRGIVVKKDLRTDQDNLSVHGDAAFPDIPMVTLINGGSASASEIVAGALRDNDRSILIGEKTFGKGSIQEMHPLTQGASIKITVGKWFPPSGEDIDHIGIKPDIEVVLDQEAFKQDKDNQKDRAITELK